MNRKEAVEQLFAYIFSFLLILCISFLITWFLFWCIVTLSAQLGYVLPTPTFQNAGIFWLICCILKMIFSSYQGSKK